MHGCIDSWCHHMLITLRYIIICLLGTSFVNMLIYMVCCYLPCLGHSYYSSTSLFCFALGCFFAPLEMLFKVPLIYSMCRIHRHMVVCMFTILWAYFVWWLVYPILYAHSCSLMFMLTRVRDDVLIILYYCYLVILCLYWILLLLTSFVYLNSEEGLT